MKLLEIFDTHTQTISSNKDIKNNKIKQKNNVSGRFSHVTPDVDPHLINKVSHEHDRAYNAYANYLIKNKIAQKNPHFPRIYVDKTYMDMDDGSKKLWKMENLPFTLGAYIKREDEDVARERLLGLAEIYLNDDLITPIEKSTHLETAFDWLLFNLEKSSAIKLESWEEALEILDDFMIKSRFKNDLYEENIMVRITPHGPQLVLTDPVG